MFKKFTLMGLLLLGQTLWGQSFDGCQQDQIDILKTAEEILITHLEESIDTLSNAPEKTNGIRFYKSFGGPDNAKQEYVLNNLKDMQNYIINQEISYECNNYGICADTGAVALASPSAKTIYFCPSHWERDTTEQEQIDVTVGTMTHELAHVAGAGHFVLNDESQLDEVRRHWLYESVSDAYTIPGFILNINYGHATIVNYTMKPYSDTAVSLGDTIDSLPIELSDWEQTPLYDNFLYKITPKNTVKYTFFREGSFSNSHEMMILDSNLFPIASGSQISDVNTSQGIQVSSVLIKDNIYYLEVPPVTDAYYRTLSANIEYNIQDFVKRFYKEVLGREADGAGLQNWIDKLATGENVGADIARGFIFSDEFIDAKTTDIDFLTILYRAFFNRESDSEGLNVWLSKLEEGTSRYEVLDGFLYSLEFENLCKSYSIIPVNDKTVEAFVKRFYITILNREPDAEGLANWVEKLKSGESAGSDIARGFIFSDEFNAGLRRYEEFISILYSAFFDRETDFSGFAYWLNNLREIRGWPYDKALDGFLYSEEFSNLCKVYGITAVK